MRFIERFRSRIAAFVHDLLMIPVAWLAAYWLRYNLGAVPEEFLTRAVYLLPVVILVQGTVFWYFGLYRGVWRFASIPDLIRILKAVVVGVSLCTVAIFLVTRMEHVPRSVFPLFGVLLTILLGGSRAVYRWLKDRRLYYPAGQRQALVVGAGRGGELLVRDLLRDPSYGYFPVAIVDDSLNKKGREIHGVRVVGPCDEIPSIVRRMSVDIALIALPSANSSEMRRIVSLCERAGIPVRTLPGIHDLVSGRASIQELREISIEDLLGRDPVTLDWKAISRGVAGRTIVVTGGGGSVGSELSRQLARLGPKSLVLTDASEFNLYQIERELRSAFPHLVLHVVLGDVCDSSHVEQFMARFQPDAVFHAAAYKHVPMLELQAREAVRNNAFGTRNVARAAARHGCGVFVLISTDKAVNPASVMGASKRLAELVCQSAGRENPHTRFITVRFGNVLDSAGSVVPLFREQIARGGPVTVTHPEVRRYFMTVTEACQLIVQAAAIGRGGEIFVLDMGKPVKIDYLAEQMIRLAGRIPGEDIEVRYIGLRPGEKLVEDLFNEHERLSSTAHAKILLAHDEQRDWSGFEPGLDELWERCRNFDEPGVRRGLRQLVPRYTRRLERDSATVVALHEAHR